jgi:hypothetical protein
MPDEHHREYLNARYRHEFEGYVCTLISFPKTFDDCIKATTGKET